MSAADFARRRFLFATIGYPPFTGGAQTYARQLAESLVADGHEVSVVTSDAVAVDRVWDGRSASLPAGEEVVNGVHVLRLRLRHLPPPPWGYFGLRRATVALAQLPALPEGLLWRLAAYTPWLPGLSTALQQQPRPDIVHSFAIPFESILHAAEQYAAGRGVPHVVTPFLHTGAPDDASVRRGYLMPHQRALLRRAAAVVALSEAERAALIGAGVVPGRVYTVPAGLVDGQRSRGQEDRSPRGKRRDGARPLVLFLGAVSYDKGAVHLVDAVRRLRIEGLGVEAVLAGDVVQQFQRYYAQLPADVRRCVRLAGIVSEAEKAALLERCTVLALPSRVDSFGLVLLEAWAHARPVIGALAGGIPAVVDQEQNGLLVPFGDVPALAAAIRRLVQQPEFARALGEAGRRKLEARYTWERVYPKLLAVYETVLRSS